MKVILQQDVADLGKKFEVKEVKEGYFRNFLHPRKLAILATKATEEQAKKTEARLRTRKEDKEKKQGVFLEKISSSGITIASKVNKKDKLYNGVDTNEIIQAVKDGYNYDLKKDQIDLGIDISHFKKLGEYKITILGKKASLRVVPLTESK